MAEVTGNLGGLPESDVAAIAAYTASIMGEPSPERRQQAEALLEQVGGKKPGGIIPAADSQAAPAAESGDISAAIYASACAPCHESGRPQPFGGLPFALSTAVNAPTPQNIINVTLFGLPAADGEASSVMPGFAGVLSDEQMAGLLDHLRTRFTDKPGWADAARLVRATRSGEHHVRVLPSDGIERAPANVGAED
jgi:mono/diheme cytochrome c family protein